MDEKAKKTLKILEEMTREETREPRRKYLNLSRAARVYRISRDRLVDRAKKAGAYYDMGNRNILINMDKLDEYFEKTGELKSRYPDDDDESEEDED